MAKPLVVQPRDTFSISQTEPDVNRPILWASEPSSDKPEVKLPQPAPVAAPDAAPAGYVRADKLPLDLQSELYAQLKSVPTAPPSDQAPSGMQDAVEALAGDPKSLFDLSVQMKGKLDLDHWAVSHPERMKDPVIASTIADAMAMETERGFHASDIDFGSAWNALWHLPLNIAKWGSRAADLITAEVGQTFVKPLTPAAQHEFEKIQAREAAELVTGTNVGAEGLAGMIHKIGDKSVRKVAEWTGLRAKPTERTPEEKIASMNARIEAAKRRELTARGNGILTQAFLGGVMDDLRKEGVQLDPEAVNTFAAGDPVTFAAFAGGFKLLGAGGKLLGTVTTKGQAIRAIERLQASQQVAAKAGYEHAAALDAAGKAMDVEQSIARAAAGAKSAPIPGELPLTDASRTMTAGASTQSAVQAAEVAGKTAAQAEADFARAAELAGQPLKGTIGFVARRADAAANIADWAKKAAVADVERGTDFVLGTGVGAAGAGLKAAQFGTWAIRGLTPDLAAPPLLKAAPKVLGAIGDKALHVSSALLKNAPERFGPVTQLASDAAKAATVDIPTGMVKGGLMDYTLAAVTNETPTENANSGVMMSALGGLEGIRFGAGRLVKGQMTSPHNYGSERPVRGLGNFADLDAATELSLKQAEKSPGVTRRLAAMREFFGPANTDMHFVSDPKQFEEVLRKYYPGMTEENIVKARNAGGVNIPNVQIPGTGKTRNLAIFNELSAAEHEGIHGWQNVFSTAGRQKLNQLARTEYAQQWEDIGNGYANRFLTPEQRMGYAQKGEGWREALLDFTQGSPEWRDEGWTPDQIRDTADNYIANEVVADVGGSILQSNRGNLEKAPGFPGKLARILGKTMDVMGVEPLAGETTSQVGIPLKVGAREKIRLGLRDAINDAGLGKIRAKFEAAKAGKPVVSEKTPVLPNSEKIDSDEIATTAPNEPTTRGGRTQREIAADISTAIKSGAGVSIDYMSAPGEPAGAVTSNRIARRNIIEAFRTMPIEARKLWEKTFFPEKMTRTQSGEIQVQGWSPEVFAANAHKLAAELHRAKAGDLTPYPIDPKTGSFTADGWRLLFDDTVQFSKNQMAGLTGAGEPLVVPESMIERGFTQPTEAGEPGRRINQDRADVISMLMGIPLPKTGRVGTVFPRNLAGQAVSEATLPGRTSLPVTPREFKGKNAEKFGVSGQPVKEVNPLRAELDLRGIKPDMVEAIQKLNLSHIAEVEPNANLPVVRGREFTVQAGFAPKSGTEWAKLKPEEVLDEVKAGGQPLTRTAWEVGKSASAEDMTALRKAESEASAVSRASLKAGKLDDAMQAAMAKQFFSEAIQMNEGKVLPDPVPASFSPKTEAGKALEEKGYTLEHTGYPGFRSISVLKDGKTVGQILSSMKEDPEQVHVAGVDVNREFRNQGIADALYRELFTDLQADGVTRVDGYVVHPAPIKTREKLLGEGMTNYYQAGKPISIEQALADVSGKTVLGPRAVSALAPDLKFAPNAKGFIGTIEHGDEVRARLVNLATSSHRSLGMRTERGMDETNWRFNPETGQVFWWGKKVPPQETQDLVNAWLENKGHSVKQHVPIESSTKRYVDAHGGGIDAVFAPAAKPDPAVNAVADEYAKDNGLTYSNISPYTNIDRELTKRIGKFYDEAKHDPQSPEVKASYNALIDETMAQYEALKKAGYEIEVVKDDPYSANIDDMLRDIRENKHVAILSTKESFTEPADYPMLRPVPGTDMVVNDLFRAVHDINGHARLGTDFTDEGEFNAWKSHQQMYSDKAQGAIAAETLGQNAWNTNGPHYYNKEGVLKQPGDEGYVPTEQQPFAGQKATVVPKELIDAARATFAPKKSDDLKFEPTSFGTASKAWIKPDGSVVQLGAQWHHDWLSEHPEVQAKYGFKVKPFEGNDTEADRSQAIKAGFGRVNFEPNSGTMTVEVRQKDWKKLRPSVEDLADANIDNIDKFKLHLLNEAATKAVDSRYASLFDADSNKEKLQRLTDVLESKANFAPKSERGETEGLPGLDVPREYVTPAERATMTRQEVRDRFPEAIVPRANGETIPSDVVNSPLYKQAKSEPEAVNLFADRLVKMAKEYETHPEYELGSRWYSEFTPMLKKEFGKDSDLMAELLAATSPQTGVETNFGYAFDALQSWKSGRFDKIIPKFEQGLAKMEDGSWETWLKRNDIPGTPTPALFMAHWIEKNNLKPTQSNGKLYGQHSLSVLKVFARRWMDSNAGPKTRNFVGNLLGKSDEATIDLWADRTMRWAGYEGLQDRWRVLPENLHSVSDADYAFAEKAFRAAAEDLKLKPSALQGALWFAEKKRWSDNGWGRLDLGNFQNEMEKLPLLRAGFEQRLATKKAKSKAKPTEQLGFDIQPRFK